MELANPQKAPVPVTILTGFLGSGKTTLLNELLKQPELSGAAVIINEFGEVGIDHHLIETADDSIIELSNGCLCCTVRGDLVDTLQRLLDQERTVKSIIMETTGLADPGPVIQAVIATPQLAGRLLLEGVIAVFDSQAGLANLERHREACRQLQLADLVVLSKTDLMDASSLDEVRKCLASETPAAMIAEKAEFLKSPADMLAQLSASAGTPAATGSVSGKHHEEHRHSHRHDVNRHSDSVRAAVLRTHHPISRKQISLFVDLLLSAHGDHVLRMKGLVWIEGESGPLLIQAVGKRLAEPSILETWADGAPQTCLVIILQDMDPGFVRQLFEGFTGVARPDQPDAIALTENPLAIPGMPSPSQGH